MKLYVRRRGMRWFGEVYDSAFGYACTYRWTKHACQRRIWELYRELQTGGSA